MCIRDRLDAGLADIAEELGLTIRLEDSKVALWDSELGEAERETMRRREESGINYARPLPGDVYKRQTLEKAGLGDAVKTHKGQGYSLHD